jgi:hypothetical protein
MAQDQLNQRYYQKADHVRHNSSIKNEQVNLTEIPEFPTTKEILLEADVLKTFIDKQ